MEECIRGILTNKADLLDLERSLRVTVRYSSANLKMEEQMGEGWLFIEMDPSTKEIFLIMIFQEKAFMKEEITVMTENG